MISLAKMKKFLLVSVFIILFSIPSIKSLLPKGGYTSHDLTHQVVRQINMDKLLSEGQFPPRWSGDLNRGFGYPLFIFIYPAPAVFGEIFLKLGFDYVESVKAVLLVSMLIGAVGMYLFLDSLFPKNRLASFLGAMFYLYAPVRFLNVYVSAALGNALALGILPFIFWAIVKTVRGKKWAIPVGGVFLALLITSHNVTTLMFAPVITAFSLIFVYKSKDKLTLLKSLGLMAALGAGLSAFFWIPAIYEKQFIVYDQALGNFWQTQFPSLNQIIHSPWGYGLSHPEQNGEGGLSFQIGLAHIFAAMLMIPIVFLLRKRKELLTWGMFSVAVFLSGTFLMLKISTSLWQKLPLLYLVQFPARFMALSVFAASIAAALLVIYLPFKKIVFVFLLALVLYANRNHLNINERFAPGMNYYLERTDTTTSANEHLPKWAYLPQNESPGKLAVLKGSADVKILENKSAKVTAEINVHKDSDFRFNQFYYPGWVLKDNGNVIDFNYQGDGESRGLPEFSLSKGKHAFEADFTKTPDRKIADAISLVSLGILAIMLYVTLNTPKD